jgi:hypothetical protein
MSRIVRLTESDLIKLVKRVIKESEVYESYWDRIFGKPETKDASNSALR